GRACQDLVHQARGEFSAGAVSNAFAVQLRCYGANALSGRLQIEYPANDRGLGGVYSKTLLDGVATRLHRHSRETVRGWSAVPEALPGILLHRSQHVLGVLATLVLIEHGAELPKHLTG